MFHILCGAAAGETWSWSLLNNSMEWAYVSVSLCGELELSGGLLGSIHGWVPKAGNWGNAWTWKKLNSGRSETPFPALDFFSFSFFYFILFIHLFMYFFGGGDTSLHIGRVSMTNFDGFWVSSKITMSNQYSYAFVAWTPFISKYAKIGGEKPGKWCTYQHLTHCTLCLAQLNLALNQNTYSL